MSLKNQGAPRESTLRLNVKLTGVGLMNLRFVMVRSNIVT